MKKTLQTLAALMLAGSSLLALAHPLHVDQAWIRPTVPGQQGTGGFMVLKSKEGVTLTGVSAPASVGSAELHEMAMVGDVMQMRAIDSLSIPAGKAVELKPGGHHLMLVGLKAPLTSGTQVPVTFHFKDAKGQTGKVEVKIPVGMKPAAQDRAAQPEHGHGKHGH